MATRELLIPLVASAKEFGAQDQVLPTKLPM